MLRLTSDAFLHPEIKIAGIDAQVSGKPSVTAEKLRDGIEEYIRALERPFLAELCGEADITENTNLLSYLSDETAELSPFAQYVYFFYTRDHSTFSTMVGERSKTADNSKAVSASPRLVRVWNSMVAKCHAIADEINNDSRDGDIFDCLTTYGL